MTYIFLVLIILENAGETISYKNTKCNDCIVALFGICLLGLIISSMALAISYLVNGIIIFEGINVISISYIALVSILGILGVVFWFIASKNLPMSIAEGVSEIYIAFLTLLSWVFFGGKLTLLQILLVVIIIIACIVLAFVQSGRKNNLCSSQSKITENVLSRKFGYRLNIGFLFLALWVVVAVVKGLIPGVISRIGISNIVYSFLMNIFMMIFACILMLIKKKNFKSAIKVIFKDIWLFVISICRITSQLVILHLALQMNLGIVDAISVLGLIIIMLYERWIMKEKISPCSYLIMFIITIATGMLCII